MRIKLLIINLDDEQEIIKINQSGSYYDKSKVMWDERIDGKLDSEIEQHVGYLKREDKQLVIDDDLMVIHNERKIIKDEQKLLDGILQNRRNEYPSIPDQLDDIYHNGIDGWKASIKLIKDKYPKPQD